MRGDSSCVVCYRKFRYVLWQFALLGDDDGRYIGARVPNHKGAISTAIVYGSEPRSGFCTSGTK